MQAMADAAGGRGRARRPAGTTLWADPDRIIQTLTNLLSNAVKFSPGGGTVTVSAERAGDEVLLRVADQGRGIPADKLETIFERFQQVDASDSRQKGGTGLGLAICRGIVRAARRPDLGGERPRPGEHLLRSSLPAMRPPAAAANGATGGPTILVCGRDVPAPRGTWRRCSASGATA